MKGMTFRRSGQLALLSLLALLVLAIGAQAVLAAAQPPTRSQIAKVHGRDGGVAVVTVTTQRAGTDGRGGASPLLASASGSSLTSSGAASTAVRRVGVAHGRAGIVVPHAARPASISTGGWVAIAAVLAAIVAGLGVWALVSRRQPAAGSPEYCALHPDAAICAA